VLFLSIVLAKRGSRRAQLVWLGALAHVAYTYLYTFAIAWNRLFLVSLMLLSLSAFTIVRPLTAVDGGEVAGRFSERTPVRGVGTFLWGIGGARTRRAGPGGARAHFRGRAQLVRKTSQNEDRLLAAVRAGALRSCRRPPARIWWSTRSGPPLGARACLSHRRPPGSSASCGARRSATRWMS